MKSMQQNIMMSMGARILLFFFLGVNLAQAQQKPELPTAFESFFPKGYSLEEMMISNSASKQSALLLARHFNLSGNGDTLKAFIVDQVGAEINVKSVVDFISKEKEETSISFIPTSCLFINDSTILVSYQTAGPNGKDDGRLKLILYVGEKKVGIRHQNGVLDFQRYMQVDAAFYSLPFAIQEKVKSNLIRIETEGYAILPANWKEAMLAKQTMIKEN